ncbi:DUF3488 and transglutaminase-like domain-containing protein [Endozoicomonas sp. 8E]|uniref:transglutaminase TgpA family protein n=1 Tax=Endozoicomonas sp. 8E TaxID=3035692 RepID=UPI002938DDF7|nr:DUF3488 and transglutaminase-like domain-containing protein [Endozoicomonas sp. 8E]WOG29936.1 DUF3488 and transglutaminase-like domain-containing protein [Endozoicomonas sp. 8E]
MLSNAQVSRTSTLWLTAALLSVLLPIWKQVPTLIILLGCLSAGWRITILLGRGQWPPFLLRLGLILIALVTVIVSFRPLISLESSVSFLAAGYALKLLEMRSQRDALVVIYIGYFLVATAVLFSQSLLQTLYLMFCLVMLIAAQQGLFRSTNAAPVISSVRFAGLLVLQAAPLTVLLFVLVPRMGPLWSVPLPDNSARTGLTDAMTPGDIAKLSRSDELVFRARFAGDVPPPRQRYWRAVVLDQFDGKTWKQTDKPFSVAAILQKDWVSRQPESEGWWKNRHGSYQYEVMMEPTGKPWMYTLGAAGTVAENSFFYRTMRLVSDRPIDSRLLYSLDGMLPQTRSVSMPDWLAALNTQIPDLGNDRSRQYALRLFNQAGQDPMKMAARLLSLFRLDDFHYTLSPPLYDQNSTVDEFLFEGRRGFCAHYAGAFVYLMRAAGVPARVIGGYQGGEFKEADNLIQVRQFDAHAWAEIWVAGQGWLRFDPTAAVSPQRIEAGLEAAIGSSGTFLPDSPLSLYRYRESDFINRVRLAFEKAEYQWQRSVVNFKQDQQEAFLRSLLGDKDFYWRQGVALTIGVSVILAILSLTLLYRRQTLPPLQKLYARFLKKMARRGFVPQEGEAELSFARRISQSDDRLTEPVMSFCEVYMRAAYGEKHSEMDELKRLLTRF